MRTQKRQILKHANISNVSYELLDRETLSGEYEVITFTLKGKIETRFKSTSLEWCEIYFNSLVKGEA